MKPHRRIHTTAKWACVALSVLSGAAWLVSARWTISMRCQFGDWVGIGTGCAAYIWTSPQLRANQVRSNGVPPQPNWRWQAAPRQAPMQWWISPLYGTTGQHSRIAIVLWVPCVAAAAAALLLWRLEKSRSPPGCCPKCLYDRTGLAPTALCPECGTPPGDKLPP